MAVVVNTYLMRLSTQALKPDSLNPDPRSGFNVYADYVCYIAGLDHAAQIWIEAVWRQSGFWIRIPDAHRIRI